MGREEKFARWLAWMVTGSVTEADTQWRQFLNMAREGLRIADEEYPDELR